MSEFLEITIDKFTFKVAADRLYTADHLWLKPEMEGVRVGLSDYLQQTSGDVAFAELQAEGTTLTPGDELAAIETMKTNLSIPSPISGVIKAINPRLEDEPELINEAPYEAGWLVLVEPNVWEEDKLNLLDAQAYFARMTAEAEQEAKNR
ncbi:MAG: glycine cleavage system protein H [Anaerolineae bacterium]|nr:glycine cleavage system protein H [Anaerolineae bacterium]